MAENPNEGWEPVSPDHPQYDAVANIPVEHADPETTEIITPVPVTDSRGCRHYFVRKSETEAECRNPGCKLGLFINPADQIIDGQLPDLRST